MIIFLFSLISSISNRNFLIKAATPPVASAEENKSALAIAQFAKQKIDKCYQDLGTSLANFCINLDVDKRIKLAISIMICEQNRDGRGKFLPPYNSDLEFIGDLDQENFNIFTIYFINIDNVCFHSVKENITAANIQRILSVYQTVNLSTEYLIVARKCLDELMTHVRMKFQEYKMKFDEEYAKFQSIQASIVQMIGIVKIISDKALFYRSIVTNAKYYLISLGISFFINIFLPNVFLPTLFVICFYLIIEITVSEDHINFTTHFLYKWSFVFMSAIIVLISLINEIRSTRKKKEETISTKHNQLVLSEISYNYIQWNESS